MKKGIIFVIAIVLAGLIASAVSCSDEGEGIEDDKLGFIDADVRSEDTNLSTNPRYGDNLPGDSKKIARSFKHQPPMIPHTTDGFFPIRKGRNVCISCHMPKKAKKIGAKPVHDSHFASLRPKPVLKDGKYVVPEDATPKKFKKKKMELTKDDLNQSYFNCSQCHSPQAEISVQIKNLFTTEVKRKLAKD